ncbi:MAG TPA: tetratricopeptide repeat protein [Vicinamibacterales bacterium]|nr:tetratricopeptide repeat protein [Vicinamibacterales bacterium]
MTGVPQVPEVPRVPRVRLPRASCFLSFVWFVLLSTAGTAWPAGRDLTGVDALARVYDLLLNADFDAAETALAGACPPAPREACDVMAATITWWRIQLDPEDRSLDATFSQRAERAIASTETWASHEPTSAEAQFYAGAAYAARVQWRVLRDEKLSAARDGKRIKQALDRAIALDADLDDAYFGLGLYEYYADVAPAAAKVLRFLLLLPGGDRTEGLARMRRARAAGKLLQGEADYQLQIIYLWYEKRVDLAVGLLTSLHDRYPGNPLFASQLADVQDRYQHDITAALATWHALAAAAHDRQVNEPALAEAQARLGAARQLEALHETDQAIEQVRGVIEAKAIRPYGALAAAYLALGEGEDRLGHHDSAIAAYRLALGAIAPGAPDPDDVRHHAADAVRRTPDPTRAEAYRVSIEGLRKLEHGDAADAISLLTHSLRLEPADPVTRYRYGRALEARKENVEALDAFEATISDARACPAPIAAAAYLDAGRLHERLAHRQQAIEYYRAASTWFGAGADTRAAALRALARLHAQTATKERYSARSLAPKIGFQGEDF